MKPFLVLLLAAACGSIGCSESAPTVSESSPQDAPHRTMPPEAGGNVAGNKQSIPDSNGKASLEQGSQTGANGTTDRSAELDDVFEALFRYQFYNNVSAEQQQAETYFLTIKNRNPPSEFLKRFSGHTPPVKNGSEFGIGKGLKFRIDGWEWISDDKINVIGGYYEDVLSSSGSCYFLFRKDGKWVVEKADMYMISWIHRPNDNAVKHRCGVGGVRCWQTLVETGFAHA